MARSGSGSNAIDRSLDGGPARGTSRTARLRLKAQRLFTRLFGPARRLAIRAVKVEDMPGADIREWKLSVRSVETPGAATMNMHPQASSLRRAAYEPPSPITAVLPDVWFAPRYHTVFKSRRELLADSVSTGSNSSFVSVLKLWRTGSARLPGLSSTFRSYQNTYYHTLIDNLPRLYLLQQLQPFLDTEVHLLCSGELNPAETYLLPKLLPEGVHVKIVRDDRFYQLERFAFLGFLTRRFSGWLPPECLDWYQDLAAPSRPSKKSRRILISREPTKTRSFRSIVNEEEVMEALGPLGFERSVPDKLELQQQVELFYDADFVIGAHGAGLANLVFGRNTKVIELFPSRMVVPHYFFLSKACGHPYAHWCGSGAHRNSDIVVDLNELLSRIRSLEED